MILNALPGIEVVGEAADGHEAVALARSLRPDVCLFDIRMPELDGIEATRQLAGPEVADPLADTGQWPTATGESFDVWHTRLRSQDGFRSIA